MITMNIKCFDKPRFSAHWMSTEPPDWTLLESICYALHCYVDGRESLRPLYEMLLYRFGWMRLDLDEKPNSLAKKRGEVTRTAVELGETHWIRLLPNHHVSFDQ